MTTKSGRSLHLGTAADELIEELEHTTHGAVIIVVNLGTSEQGSPEPLNDDVHPQHVETVAIILQLPHHPSL